MSLKAKFSSFIFSIISNTISLSSDFILLPANDTLPNIIVSITLIGKTLLLYWGTYPIFPALFSGVKSAIFSPFKNTFPLLGFKIWFIHFNRVVFPVPFAPRRNMASPCLTSIFILFNMSYSELYPKHKFSTLRLIGHSSFP